MSSLKVISDKDGQNEESIDLPEEAKILTELIQKRMKDCHSIPATEDLEFLSIVQAFLDEVATLPLSYLDSNQRYSQDLQQSMN